MIPETWTTMGRGAQRARPRYLMMVFVSIMITLMVFMMNHQAIAEKVVDFQNPTATEPDSAAASPNPVSRGLEDFLDPEQEHEDGFT
jgi:hypothetical protein